MLERPRIFDKLADAKRVLIAGAGGGYDVYAGLPLYSALARQGCEVFFANLSFTSLAQVESERAVEALVPVLPDTVGPSEYFPEKRLAQFLHARGYTSPIYAIPKTGLVPIREAYEYLAEQLSLDALLMVDVGTDILMRGDERGLGTPVEDITSLAATRKLAVPTKAVCCIGFGIDAFHGVRHAEFLENVASLTASDSYWGAFSVLPSSPDGKLYLDAVAHAEQSNARSSIVNGSIADAVEGKYGNVHRNPARTGKSTLWINPLMSLYWTFGLEGVADANLYLDDLEGTQSVWDVQLKIEAARHRLPARKGPTDIPH